MDNAVWLKTLRKHKAIAILRAPTVTTGIDMAKAAVAGGFRLIEVTWNSDRPAALVEHLRAALPTDCLVGVGTVLSTQETQTAIAAGAQFCFAPHTDEVLIQQCQAHAVPIIPGALTPTEIATAWRLGASSVKVFPCQTLGGATYIRHLQGPLSHIPLIPTGGITVDDGPELLAAGAIAVGIASSLYPQDLVKSKNWSAIAMRSRIFLHHLENVSP